jgi:hypothetical protein
MVTSRGRFSLEWSFLATYNLPDIGTGFTVLAVCEVDRLKLSSAQPHFGMVLYANKSPVPGPEVISLREYRQYR